MQQEHLLRWNAQGLSSLQANDLSNAMEHFQKAFDVLLELCKTTADPICEGEDSKHDDRQQRQQAPLAPAAAPVQPSPSLHIHPFVQDSNGAIFSQGFDLQSFIIFGTQDSPSTEHWEKDDRTMSSAALIINMALCYHRKASLTTNNALSQNDCFQHAATLYAKSYNLLFHNPDIGNHNLIIRYDQQNTRIRQPSLSGIKARSMAALRMVLLCNLTHLNLSASNIHMAELYFCQVISFTQSVRQLCWNDRLNDDGVAALPNGPIVYAELYDMATKIQLAWARSINSLTNPYRDYTTAPAA